VSKVIKGRSAQWLRKHWKTIFSVSVLMISLVIGSYLRLYPVWNARALGYGPTLYELDPYSEYWIANQLYHNGLDYFNYLRRFNSITHIFWFPWGRDFTRSSLPMLPYFSVITYNIARAFNPSLTLYEWMVYLPILFFIMAALGVYLTVRELWGDIPAAFAIVTASLIFVSRHIAGFTVKYSIGMAFLFPAIYFHVRAWKRTDFVSAAFAGIFLAFAAMSWAGFNLVLAAIAVQIALLPLIRKITLNDFYLLALELIPLASAIAVTPFYGGYNYLIRSVGLVIPGIFAVFFIAYGIQRLASNRNLVISFPLLKRYKLIYFSILVLIVLAGFYALVTGKIAAAGKALAAMGLGTLTHVIVETVQEYQKASASAFISQEGAALIVAVPILIYLAYRVITKKNIAELFIASLFVLAVFATVNESYFFPFTNYVVAITSAAFPFFLLTISKKGRSTWFSRAIALTILTMFAVAIIAQGTVVWARNYRATVPTIIESGMGLGTDIPAWLDALNWIKNNTPKDAVVVAWWDYGYWISVVGERASVADGATLNTTQIELLARALTGTEDEALQIFTKDFKINPSKLYIAVYEAYLVHYRGEGYVAVYPGPIVLGRYVIGADAAKGIAAIYKIAGRKAPTFTYVDRETHMAVVLPNWTDPQLRNATLFKIILNTAYVIWGDKGAIPSFYYYNPYSPPTLPRPKMYYFKPAYIAISEALPLPIGTLYIVVSVYKFSPSS